jgi:hypothetical protein
MTVVAVTRSLAVGAVVLGGIVAGFSVNRLLVELPAWVNLGPEQWASFTRHADLGKGLVVYPLEGLAALVCSVGAAVLAHFDRSDESAFLPLHLAGVGALLAFFVTRFLIAPEVLTLRGDSPNPSSIQNAFAAVRSWWQLKAGLHTITFACNVWGLMTLMSH